MKELVLHTVTVFMGFFAIMNPIANIPIFLGLTSDEDRQTVKSIALRSVLIAFGIVFVFVISGKLIFDLFGITLYALRITGGILVFLIGFNMLQGNSTHYKTKEKAYSPEQQQAALSVAVSPLATPILAGPGTIATAMNFATAGGFDQTIITIVAFGVLCAITYVLFLFGNKLVKAVGPSALNVVTKMMGLILAVIGTQTLIEGLVEAYKTVLA
ncbi:MarC family protein [Vibrio sp. Isolate25]|uniref:MarC family protein n=1 Tax=Vibrio TaxID=662 RepID=UPI001EFCA69E|nr:MULTISPECIES: MarC family protein [Vibrio]MCG9596231.1 MarC family protein [Vibrio sp. Isolate25]MCG9676737.1 MarC family protein [Vibrio sp. Isolate24]MCG9681858.1 MarC family protein [Vibrio sp. Isolate23]USD34884.1 MarC family protein [Vibrio sp. SCSIO 43186]USD47949.1 MarC family protein [Vibrio sp. SCSIO 43145]